MATEQRNHAIIPEEILFDILLWLPTKSLARFKCVGEEWNSIIASSFFIKKHTENVNKNLTLGNNHRLILSNSYSFHSINIEDESNVTVKQLKLPPNFGNHLMGVASCNGIVCLLFTNEEILLWNPCNREYRNLPLTRPFFDKNVFSTTDAFGFGYDQSTDDYKVVRSYSVTKTGDITRKRCKVYSLRTNSWKKIYLPKWNVDIDFATSFGTLVNSTLYWSVKLNDRDDAILCFDLVKDQLLLLSLSAIRGEISELGNFEGNLCMFQRHGYPDICVDIWVLNLESSDLDVKKSHIQLTKLTTVPYLNDLPYLELIIPVHSTKNIEDQVLLVNWMEGSLHLFNIKEKAFKMFNMEYYEHTTQAIAYTETLISLNDNGGRKRKKSRKLNKRRKKNKKLKGYRVEAQCKAE